MDAALSLIPAALGLLIWRFRSILPDGAVWLGAALAVSTLGDLWATAAGGEWYPSYVWLPVQLGLAIRAVTTGREWVSYVLVLFALGAWNVVDSTGPDMLVTGVGSIVVVTVALVTAHRLTLPILLYFGAGSFGYLCMVTALGSPAFMSWWWFYQACRVFGWLAMAEVVRAYWWEHRRAKIENEHVQARMSLQLMGR
jgi:hypothetical protein